MMQRKRLLLGGGRYAAAVRALNPLLWLRFNEIGGAAALNFGSLGAALNGAVSGATTLGQSGQPGLNEAYDLDGATSLVSVNQLGALSLPAFTFAILCRPDSAGEGDAGRFYDFGTTSLRFAGFSGTSGPQTRIRAIVAASTASADTFTTYTITPGAWAWFFITYNDAGDRLARVYRNGVEMSYSTQTAASGTLTTYPTQAFQIGNRGLLDATFDGRIDEALKFSRVLTPAEMMLLASASGLG